ncbi:MAG: para-aminobenzoate synthetase component 1 [Rickettsiales bacterium]|jgi:para-aminobenzoate synthetase component 1
MLNNTTYHNALSSPALENKKFSRCQSPPKDGNWHKKTIEWICPLELAVQISNSTYKENWIFLYSGLFEQIPNSKSYIGLYPKNEIISDDFNDLERSLKESDEKYFGYLGYELKNCLEDLKNSEKSFIDLPNLWMIKFNLILEFDHHTKKISIFTVMPELDFLNWLEQFRKSPSGTSEEKLSTQKIKTLNCNFSKSNYLKKVKSIQKNIVNGDIYQANLTRKFFGEFLEKPKNPFNIFQNLNQKSPANYSAFLKLGENYIISSSPELFLTIDENGQAKSSPIKGTAKRFLNKSLDEESIKRLKNSPKEQAENLMIVDLVRNDLSKNCLTNSVKVENLFKVSHYKTLHHLSSDIVGSKKPESTALDVVKSCFPAGSMTGAPKIKAMEICEDLEKQDRGVYSGAIGLIGSDECELSVVIRTLIIKDDKFEFQVGGAITFDSEAQKEWQETINKAKGIAKTLGIKLADLKGI